MRSMDLPSSFLALLLFPCVFCFLPLKLLCRIPFGCDQTCLFLFEYLNLDSLFLLCHVLAIECLSATMFLLFLLLYLYLPFFVCLEISFPRGYLSYLYPTLCPTVLFSLALSPKIFVGFVLVFIQFSHPIMQENWTTKIT